MTGSVSSRYSGTEVLLWDSPFIGESEFVTLKGIKCPDP